MCKCLEYPLNVDEILQKKKLLRRKLLLKKPVVEKKIAILGGSTTYEIKNILELFLLKNGIHPVFYESEYNKYYEDALFGNPQLDNFKPDVIYLHTTIMNVETYPEMYHTPDQVQDITNQIVSRFLSVWDSLKKYRCAVIQNNFELPMHRFTGNFDAYDIHGRCHFVNSLNLRFAHYAREIKYLYLQDIQYLSAQMGLTRWFDLHNWHGYKYAMSHEAIPYLANNLGHIISALLGMSRKALVVDLDNTCWGGIIGDDGLNTIQIGKETAVAESFLAFQRYVKELQKRGVLLAVASKNESKTALEGFSHPESLLKHEDFAVFKANWLPKSANIIDIAKEINIGLDSFVFIDDNPMERDIVSAQVPQVAVPDVGNDVTCFPDHIENNGYFEAVSLSEEDINRSRYYDEDKMRLNEQSVYPDYNAYLTSLKMVAVIKPFEELYLDRITQLINKTNQFNLTTRRYTMGEIQAIYGNKQYIALFGKLADKFGDYGLVSIVIGSIKDKECHLDLWLMSCRVLKRDMEYAMLNEMVKRCHFAGIERIFGYYHRTLKNDMVSGLYRQFGFTPIQLSDDKSQWELKVHDYYPQETRIKVAENG